MEPVVDVRNLTMKFNDFTAVNNITFNVQPGEVRGILGGNGAGKSTTLKILSGLYKPTHGDILISGLNPAKNFKTANQVRALLGYCPDVGGTITGSTPNQHLKLLASLQKDKSLYEQGVNDLERFGLKQFANNPVAEFSHGMMRRLSVLLANLSSKTLLILDEPYDGVDPLGVEIINQIITEARNNDKALIISTHLQSLLTENTDTISIMSKGVILQTTPSVEMQGDAGKAHYREMLHAHNAEHEEEVQEDE